MLCTENLADQGLAAHFIQPAFHGGVFLLAGFLVVNLFRASPELGACILGHTLPNGGHGHNNELVLGRVVIFKVAKAAHNVAAVKGVHDLELVGSDRVAAVLRVRGELVVAVNKLDRVRLGRALRIFQGNIADAVITGHQSHVIQIRSIVLVGNREQHIFALHIQAHAGIAHQVHCQVLEVDELPRYGDGFIILVVTVLRVLRHAVFLRRSQGAVNLNKIALDKAALEVRYFHLAAGAVGELGQHLFGEAGADALGDGFCHCVFGCGGHCCVVLCVHVCSSIFISCWPRRSLRAAALRILQARPPSVRPPGPVLPGWRQCDGGA